MFLQNKYTKWYYGIITSNRMREGYTEKHHIIPKCLGGNNEKENIVILTAREHFICHLLLTKMTEGKARASLAYAVWQMTYIGNRKRYQIKNRVYEYLRNQLSKNTTGILKTEKHKLALSIAKKGKNNGHTGMKRSDESKAKMRIAKQHITNETRAKMRNNALTRTQEHRQKIADSNRNRIVSDVTRQKMSIANKGHLAWNKGKTHTEETKAKMRAARYRYLKMAK